MTKPLALIVEDEDDLVNVFSMALISLGFDILALRDGEKALAYDGADPDLILLDYHLPKASGLTVLTEWRENGRFPNTKIIIMTASHELRHKFKNQADAVLLKPLGIRELRDFVQEFNLHS